MDQSSHKRSSFRNQIRRKQIQELFSQGRQKFASEQSEKQRQRIRKLTQTPSARNFFLLTKKQQFNKYPQKDWSFILKELLISVKFFDKDFQHWIETGLIHKITTLFKKQYRWLNLMDLTALILQAIFYYLPSDSPQVKTILNYNFIPDLVELCSHPQIKTINYLQLINTILYQRQKLKQIFIKNGLIQIIAIKLKKYQNFNNQEVFTTLTVLFRLVKIYGNHCIPNGNIISVFLPILDFYISATQNKQNLRIILKAISALAMTKKQSVLVDMFQCKNIIPFSLQLLSQGQTPQIRTGSANILASILASKYLHFSKKLIQMGAIDYMYKCITNPINHQLCLLCILTCLSNLISNSYQETQFVFQHSIFKQFLIPCSKTTDNLVNFQLLRNFIKKQSLPYVPSFNIKIKISLINYSKIINFLISLLQESVPLHLIFKSPLKSQDLQLSQQIFTKKIIKILSSSIYKLFSISKIYSIILMIILKIKIFIKKLFNSIISSIKIQKIPKIIDPILSSYFNHFNKTYYFANNFYVKNTQSTQLTNQKNPQKNPTPNKNQSFKLILFQKFQPYNYSKSQHFISHKTINNPQSIPNKTPNPIPKIPIKTNPQLLQKLLSHHKNNKKTNPTYYSIIMQLYQLLTFITILIKLTHNSTPILTTPPQLQLQQFQILQNWTQISTGTYYNIPYENTFTIQAKPIGCITLTTFTMLPKTNIQFYCQTNNITSSSIQIQCKANKQTYISQFTYTYLVIDSTQYNINTKTILFSQNSIPLTKQITKFNKIIPLSQFTPNHQYKCFIFLRGIQYQNPLKNYALNQTCNQINGNYYIKFSILNQIQQSTFHFTIIALNTYELTLNKNTQIISIVQIYKDEIIQNYKTSPFKNKNQVAHLAGWKSITIDSKIVFYSNLQKTNTQTVYSLAQSLSFQEIQIVFITSYTCPKPTDFINQIKFQCLNSRNQCTQYYQIVTLTNTSNLKNANIQSSYKIISYNLNHYIELLRHNSTHFIPFYRIPDPTTTGIIEFQMNEDYSRISFITAIALYIYAWNGTDYIQQFKFSDQPEKPRKFLSFDITSDFKTIAILTILTNNNSHILSTLLYNPQTQKYSIKQIIMPTSVNKIFVRNHGKDAFIFNQKYFYHMILSLPLGIFVSNSQPIIIQQSNIIVDIAVAPHADKIAIQYSRKTPGITQTIYGIKILQINSTQNKWIVSQISPQNFTPFTNNPHKLIFSKFGMDLILKPISGSYLAILTKTGPSIGTPFQLSEIIGKPPGSTYPQTTNNHAIAVSQNLQFILSGNTNNSLILYYCKSIIFKPNKLYQIPKAQPLSTPIITPPPKSPIQQNNKQLIKQLKNQLQQKQTINLIILKISLISLTGIILLSIFIIYQKSKITTNNIISNQQFNHLPTTINLNLNNQISFSFSFNH